MPITETELSLHGYTQQDIDAIKDEAKKRCVSFDEAAKLMVLEQIQMLKRRQFRKSLARLFRFPTMH